MNVSPSNGGTITSPNFSSPITKYPSEFTCSFGYLLTAVPNSAANYKFDHWGGSVSGSTNPISVSVVDGGKNVTAYFVQKSKSVSLQEAKNLLDAGKDVLVLDVSSASNYAASHMLCAKNYIWNSGAKSFTTSITSLNAYKDFDILVYDQAGTMSKDAADYLVDQGFESIYYMTDGLDDWIAEGYDTFTTAEDSGLCTSTTPMAYAGADQNVNENATVTLKGQGTAPDGGSISSYAWSQEEGANVTLSSKTTAQTSFTAPDLTSGDDTLIFQLTVTDNQGKKDTDSVTVNVNWINGTPVADAGPNQTVTPGTLVTLNGTGSTDPENSIASYQWSVSGGTFTPTLSKASTATPTFTAPSSSGSVTLTLTVTDSGELTDTDTVKITVKAEGTNNSPTADAGSNQTVTEGATVTLNGSATDSDGTIASYAWSQTGTPAVTLSKASIAKPTFTAPDVSAKTTLTFTLTVTDNDGATDTDTVTVTVNDSTNPPDNVAPTADAGTDQTVKAGATVVLDSSGSTDSDGTIASRTWTQSGGTPTVTLSNAGYTKPTFTAPDVSATTVLTFSLTVTDDNGAVSSADTVKVTVNKASSGGGGGGCFISSMAE